MSCPEKKRIAGKDWDLDRETENGECCYYIETNSEDMAARILNSARKMKGYIKNKGSEPFNAGDGNIGLILYFKKS